MKIATNIIKSLCTAAAIVLVSGCASTGRPVEVKPTPPASRPSATVPAPEESVPELLRKARDAFRRQYFNEAALRYREVERRYDAFAEKAADRLADCYLFLGQQKKAIEAYRRALRTYDSKHAAEMLQRLDREGI